MNGIMGWVVAAIVIVAAGVFYFWPQLSKAPVSQTPQAGQQAPATTGNAQLTGTWKSTTDAKFTREFRTDGVIYDRYEGDATPGIGGSWGAVLDISRETGLTVPPASLAGKTVIKATWENGSITTYFTVDAVSDTSLTTTDLSGNGKVTTYTKVQ